MNGLTSLFNMGKKFGGSSWLGSEDSTVRRLQYFLKNKWQRDENADQLPLLQSEAVWQPHN
ncbi:unnamed protein product [Timema podura]|uniref:Uncharacterized protein n=1 Tax=Timema podura TaxID=61482 RepID=A0ABN7PE39_TIMPD|nr:unnamed protein product [Timema podura]